MEFPLVGAVVRANEEERHILVGTIPPLAHLSGNHIPGLLVQHAVVIGLGSIRRMVTGLAEVVREHVQPLGHRNGAEFAMETAAESRGIATRYQRRACGRAHRGIRIGIGKDDPFGRQPLHVGG